MKKNNIRINIYFFRSHRCNFGSACYREQLNKEEELNIPLFNISNEIRSNINHKSIFLNEIDA